MTELRYSCTIYRHNGKGFDRYYISACHWQENKAANVLKSGNQNADGITVYIPADVWLASFGTTTLNPAKDIIIKGMCSFIFDNSSDKSTSESLKLLRENYEIHTIMSFDRKLYGSPNLQHIKISAR